MPREKWEKFGQDLNDIVGNAIKSGNYNSLGKDLSNIIEDAAKAVNDAVEEYTGGKKKPIKVNLGGNEVEITGSYSDRIRKPNQSVYKGNTVKTGIYPEKTKKKLYISEAWLQVSGVLKTVFGGLFTLGTMGAMIAEAMDGQPVPIVITATLFMLSSMLLTNGIMVLDGKKIFNRYKNTLKISENGTYASVEDLASEAGESVKKTLKRLKWMIKSNWFKEGHIDKNNTTFIASNETYALYKKSQEEFEARNRFGTKSSEEIRTDGSYGKDPKLSAEVKEVLDTGRGYLKQIKALNDRIPGKEISDKITKIEELTDRIFKRVESYPKSVGETKKLLKYYLPMIIKLLTAYADMDEQPNPGENIEKSKKEIENALGNLNEAFEKMLDGLYKETAWDVASDVSVLNAMLKREGLKDNDFEAKAESTEYWFNGNKEEKEKEEIKLHL